MAIALGHQQFLGRLTVQRAGTGLRPSTSSVEAVSETDCAGLLSLVKPPHISAVRPRTAGILVTIEVTYR